MTRGVEYRLIDACPEDEAWLDHLRRQAYADLFNETWGGWDEERHSRHFSESMKRGHISLIEVDGERTGMVQLLDRPGLVEVAEIQIAPRHQGRGIGTSVLRDVIADAGARGLEVCLRVGLTNRRAIGLYEGLGFKSVGRSETHDLMRHSTAE